MVKTNKRRESPQIENQASFLSICEDIIEIKLQRRNAEDLIISKNSRIMYYDLETMEENSNICLNVKVKL